LRSPHDVLTSLHRYGFDTTEMNSADELEFNITNRRRSGGHVTIQFFNIGEIRPMRTQLLFYVLMGIGVTGCGNSEDSRVADSAADTDVSDECDLHEVPYHLVKTMPDGSHVVQYAVETMQPETRSIMDSNGREETRSVMARTVEQRTSTIPPGEDISEFLSWHADGRIVNREPNENFEASVAPAPAPPAE